MKKEYAKGRNERKDERGRQKEYKNITEKDKYKNFLGKEGRVRKIKK